MICCGMRSWPERWSAQPLCDRFVMRIEGTVREDLRKTQKQVVGFVVKVGGDWLKLCVVWLLMWAFALLTDYFKVDGWPAVWIHKIHHVGSVIAVAVLVLDLCLNLIIELYRGLRQQHSEG